MARPPALTVFETLLAARGAPAPPPRRGGVSRLAEREAPGLDPPLSARRGVRFVRSAGARSAIASHELAFSGDQ
jgi:hypothetical protein